MPATDDDVLRAFADAIRDGLIRDRTVVVAGLGAFRREHDPSRFDDSVVPPRLLPPREIILFAPDPGAPNTGTPGASGEAVGARATSPLDHD
jgi:hypothetical protein